MYGKSHQPMTGGSLEFTAGHIFAFQKLYIRRSVICSLMKDQRFLPLEKREPVEEYGDEFLESDEDELYEMMESDGKGKPAVRKFQLYIAS